MRGYRGKDITCTGEKPIINGLCCNYKDIEIPCCWYCRLFKKCIEKWKSSMYEFFMGETPKSCYCEVLKRKWYLHKAY